MSRLSATDRRIISLAIPALGSLAVEPLYVLTDTAIVGRIGTAELGGLAIAAVVLSLVVNACTFLTYGTTERVASRIGAARGDAAANVGVQAMWLGAVISLPLALAVGFGARRLGAALGGSGDVLDHATIYLQISAISVPAVVFILTAQGVQRGASDYKTPTLILLASNGFNAVLEVILVFGFGLGIPGSAWSTVVAQILAAVVFALLLRRHLRPATQRRPSWSEMVPLLTAGRHLLLRSASMLAVLVGATAIASRTDTPTLAAHQVVAAVLTFIALALDALAIPAQTLVAEHLGRRDRVAAAETSRRVLYLTLWCAGLLAFLLVVTAPALPRLFTPDGAVTGRASAALVVLGLVVLIPASIAYALDGALIGAGDYRFLGRAALGYLVVLAPIGALVLATSAGIVAIWLGIAAWMAMRAGVNAWRAHALFAAT